MGLKLRRAGLSTSLTALFLSLKPVAITVILIASFIFSLITAPKITFASGSADPVIIFAASATSCIPNPTPPVTVKSIPLAPSIDCSSNGLDMAILAASSPRFSPLASPSPIIADPASFIIALTSAKSTLINPGIVINSEIP